MNTCISILARSAVAALVLAFAVLAACDAREHAADPVVGKASGTDASVLIDSVNYMHERGVQYTLYDLAKTPPAPIGGSIVVMLASGGEKGCCLSLPKTWRPGIKVRLDWQESDRERTYPEKYSREMEIPRYATPADLYVVFSSPHEVELVVSQAEPGHPDWRGSIKMSPWDQCVQTYGRKPCFAALPKMFDTRSNQGFCTWATRTADAEAIGQCPNSMIRCMRDFEDEVFCRGILWGPERKDEHPIR